MSTPTELKSTRRRHFIITFVMLAASLLVLGFLFRGLFINTTQIPSALLNKPAHDFRVTWLQGKEHLTSKESEHFSLQDFKGKPVILNFWASWCVSCRQEALDFEHFWQTRTDKDIMVVGIAIQDTPQAATAFAKEFGKSYILGLDTDGRAAIDYGVTGVPETFVINREGIIIHKEAGPINAALLNELAQKL